MPPSSRRNEEDDEETGTLLKRQTSAGGKEKAARPAQAADATKNDKKPIFDIVKRLLSYAAEDKKLIAAGMFFIISSSAFDTLIPNYTGRALAAIVDSVSNKDVAFSPFHNSTASPALFFPPPGAAHPATSPLALSGEIAPLSFSRAVWGLAIVSGLAAVTQGGRVWCTAITEVRLVARIQKALFEAIIRQDMLFFDSKSSGELTSRLTSDVNLLSVSLTTNLNLIGQNTVNLLGSLAMMFSCSPPLAAVFALASVVFFYGSKKFGEKEVQSAVADTNGVATQAISLSRLVRTFAAEDHETHIYGLAVNKLVVQQARTKLLWTIYMPFVTTFNAILLIGVFVYGRAHVKTPRDASDFAAFLFYTNRIQGAMSTISSQWTAFSAAMGAGEAVFDLIDRKPLQPTTGGVWPSAPPAGRLELQKVSFSYPSRPAVLKEARRAQAHAEDFCLAQCLSRSMFTPHISVVTLHLQPGQRMAIVGLSGSGKSTITALALRLYEATGGRILLDGTDVTVLDPRFLRQYVTAVQQEPPLFGMTVRENIAYNLPDGRSPTQAEMDAAVAVADLQDVLRHLPKGLDTMCGERGARLSGGQKQRVAIARALIRSPCLLLLDEATSALDAASERRVQDALEAHVAQRSPKCGMITVAHRLSTVWNAEVIVVLHKGSVQELGTHDELLAKEGGLYQSLVAHQLAATSLESVAVGGDGSADNSGGGLLFDGAAAAGLQQAGLLPLLGGASSLSTSHAGGGAARPSAGAGSAGGATVAVVPAAAAAAAPFVSLL